MHTEACWCCFAATVKIQLTAWLQLSDIQMPSKVIAGEEAMYDKYCSDLKSASNKSNRIDFDIILSSFRILREKFQDLSCTENFMLLDILTYIHT